MIEILPTLPLNLINSILLYVLVKLEIISSVLSVEASEPIKTFNLELG